MAGRLSLTIIEYENQALENAIPGFRRLRIETNLALWKDETTTPIPRLAIVDTGTAISLLPPSMWKEATIEVIKENHKIGGINTREECKMNTTVAWVHGMLLDDEFNVTNFFRFPALLTDDELEKPLIGMWSVLTRYTIYHDGKSRTAYLEGDDIHKLEK